MSCNYKYASIYNKPNVYIRNISESLTRIELANFNRLPMRYSNHLNYTDSVTQMEREGYKKH